MSRNDDADRRAWLDRERDRLRAYRATAKGKAALHRWHLSPTGLASYHRYRTSEKGRRKVAAGNARQIWIANTYHSTAKTPELAEMIRAHIKRRLKERHESQSR